MNEESSTADLLGVATGDPFLVLAGVGIGAVGGVVDEVSGLFAHKTKESSEKPPPTPLEAKPSTNLAGQGGIAEGGGGSLRQVEVGGS